MKPYEYKKMFKFEQNYWWYKGLRLFLKQTLTKLNLNKGKARVLDAGCGTGGNLKLLKNLGYKNLFGFDIDKKAVNFCHRRGFGNIITANVNNIPFENNKFDLVLCVDVFECRKVNESRAFQELLRVLKPRSYLLVVTVAFPSLLSEHDKAVDCIRRYNKKQLIKKFSTKKAKIKNIKYCFFFFSPIIALFRIIKKMLVKYKKGSPQSDLKEIPKLLNNLLYYTITIEEKIGNFIDFPFGTSLFVLIQKN